MSEIKPELILKPQSRTFFTAKTPRITEEIFLKNSLNSENPDYFSPFLAPLAPAQRRGVMGLAVKIIFV